jgi:hypothetical protein
MKVCHGCGAEFDRGKHPHQRFCTVLCSRRRGAANNRFNGGLSFNRRLGRWVIACRDGSLMYFYRAVVAAEIGRLLRPDELVHHVNEDPTDDRSENLEIISRAAHMDLHRAQLVAGRRA